MSGPLARPEPAPGSVPALTIFSTMKPFLGQAGMLQRNAILSWTLLRPRPEVILFGDEDGVADICRELGLRHIPCRAPSEFGTPLVSDLFGQARRLAPSGGPCYRKRDHLPSAGPEGGRAGGVPGA